MIPQLTFGDDHGVTYGNLLDPSAGIAAESTGGRQRTALELVTEFRGPRSMKHALESRAVSKSDKNME